MTPTPEEVKTLEVEIERLLPGGVGLAHAEGLTLFVSLAAPGDLLRIRIDREQGKVAFASIVEIIKPSDVRIEAPCPYFGRCGGSDFQQLTYETQLEAKAEIIHHCLRRTAQVEAPGPIRVMPSPNQWHYRTRASWQVDSSAKQLGYFERGSNRICDVEYCAVLTPELQQTLAQVRHELSAGNGITGPKTIDAVTGEDRVSVAPAIAGFSTDVISRRLGSRTYSFNAESFFQVNHELVEPLINEAIGEMKGQFAVDLYAGVGLFTLPLARRFAHVTAVEEYGPATEFARRNLAEAKLEKVEVVTLDVVDWLKQ